MPTADAHIHLFEGGFESELGGPPSGRDELAAYERLRRHYGIRRALVVAYEGLARYVGNNEHVLSLVGKHPWIVPLWYLPATPPPTVELLRTLGERGVAGYSIYLTAKEEGIAFARWPAPALRELRAQEAIVSLNSNPTASAAVSDVVDALEGCSILFSHLGLPGRFTQAPSTEQAQEHLRPLLRLADRGHVAVKLSGLYAVSDPGHDFPHIAARPFVDVLLESFSPARLLWGSDFSPALDFVSFAQAADARVLADCSSSEVGAVMGGNLIRLLADRAREM